VCAHCGLDTQAVDAAVREWQSELLGIQARIGGSRYWLDGREFQRFRHSNSLDRCLWEAHHKLAVSEGGGMCGLENYETVCIWCHKKETKKLRGRLKQKRTGQLSLQEA
jgi:hypothetical protein